MPVGRSRNVCLTKVGGFVYVLPSSMPGRVTAVQWRNGRHIVVIEPLRHAVNMPRHGWEWADRVIHVQEQQEEHQ